ncbi:MAG TPA: hypothetical protein VKA09_00795 [Nitrososphaeraceae archaeon]|nr:hypothetical protein [Nitrososphaeraceae archaeon]
MTVGSACIARGRLEAVIFWAMKTRICVLLIFDCPNKVQKLSFGASTTIDSPASRLRLFGLPLGSVTIAIQALPSEEA